MSEAFVFFMEESLSSDRVDLISSEKENDANPWKQKETTAECLMRCAGNP